MAPAEALSARAYTVADDIFFAPGAFAPQTPSGARLLAHELAHVIEQRRSGPRLQRQTLTAEARRRGELIAEYNLAVETRSWPRAAELLNGFNDEDIASRLRVLSHDLRIQIYAGALRSMPGFHARVTGAIAAVDPEARRVGTLTFDYLRAVEQGQWARAAELLNAFNDADITTHLRQLAEGQLTSLHGAGPRFQRVTSAVEVRRGEIRLRSAIDRITRIHPRTGTEAAVGQIEDAIGGLDMGSPSTLRQVVTAIGATFGEHSRAILALFLTRLAASRRASQPTPADEARMTRTIGMMQVQPRGPYGHVGPGVLLPQASQVLRPLLPLIETISRGFEGAGAFLGGVLEGMAGSLTEEQRRQLADRLVQSSDLNLVFIPIFAAGAAVGIVQDVVEAVRGIYRLITHFGEFLSGMRQLLTAMFGPDSAAIGRAAGLEVGRGYGARIGAAAAEGVVEFTYDLGRVVGPTIVYVILAFVGVPQVAASALVTRLLVILRPLLQRFPRLLRMLEVAAATMQERAGATMLERALEARRLAQRLEAVRAAIRAAVRSPSIVTHTFEEAVRLNVTTEGAGLARVAGAIPDADFRSAYSAAFDGMNNREIWESVLTDIAREAEAVPAGSFTHPEITSRASQAVVNLSERAAGPGGRVIMTPGGDPGFPFFDQNVPWGPRFYDVNIGRGHGMTSHLVQDLVVDRALQRAGIRMTAEQFRGRLGTMARPMPGFTADLRTLLWNALYDAEEGRLTSPDTVIAVLRAALGEVD